MKFKKLIFSFIFLFLTTESLFAKALPPGSGIGDVPANVLIMLDKSGSMGWRMSGGLASMRYPYDADADSSGNIDMQEAMTWLVQKGSQYLSTHIELYKEK